MNYEDKRDLEETVDVGINKYLERVAYDEKAIRKGIDNLVSMRNNIDDPTVKMILDYCVTELRTRLKAKRASKLAVGAEVHYAWEYEANGYIHRITTCRGIITDIDDDGNAWVWSPVGVNPEDNKLSCVEYFEAEEVEKSLTGKVFSSEKEYFDYLWERGYVSLMEK